MQVKQTVQKSPLEEEITFEHIIPGDRATVASRTGTVKQAHSPAFNMHNTHITDSLRKGVLSSLSSLHLAQGLLQCASISPLNYGPQLQGLKDSYVH